MGHATSGRGRGHGRAVLRGGGATHDGEADDSVRCVSDARAGGGGGGIVADVLVVH